MQKPLNFLCSPQQLFPEVGRNHRPIAAIPAQQEQVRAITSSLRKLL